MNTVKLMKYRQTGLMVLCAVCLLALSLLSSQSSWLKSASGISLAASAEKSTPAASGSAKRALIRENYGKLPLRFEANQGQAAVPVKFIAHGQGYAFFLTDNEAVMEQGKPGQGNTSATLRIKLAGANRQPRISGAAQMPGKMNYFIGNDSTQWKTDMPTYGQVKYEAVYPGIDLVYYGNQQQLEFDFMLAPGADPKQIKVSFAGAQKLRLDKNGDLIVETKAGEVRQHRPVVYQEINGHRQQIAGSYKLSGKREVRFEIGDYDQTMLLVIDPALSYATFISETGGVALNDIAVDTAGNAYLVGGAQLSKFFTTPGALQPVYDGKVQSPAPSFALIFKLNPTGTQVLYSAMLSGSQSVRSRVNCTDRHDEEDPTGCYRYLLTNNVRTVFADAAGNAYVTRETQSIDFPVTAGAYKASYQALAADGQARINAFALKLNPQGSQLLYSTMFDGTLKDIAVDLQGQAWLTGTSDATFPVTPNAVQSALRDNYAYDATVAKLNAAGTTLLYATFLGGGSSDSGFSIALDAVGDAYVTGLTDNGYGRGQLPRGSQWQWCCFRRGQTD
ncbi:MAG: hypothetical protein M3X11_00120 [Acidobacteriota bacterium]|nr:hypothetical protein [Acidobacteriota bacterium]